MLKRNLYSKGLAFLFAASLFTACQDDDYAERVNRDKPVATLDKVTATAVEGDAVTFTITMSQAISEPISYKLELLDESTGAFRDYTVSGLDAAETDVSGDGGYGQGPIGYLIEVPAFTETASFTINLMEDYKAGTNKTFKLRLRSAMNGNGVVAADSEIITLTVNDFVSNGVGAKLVWAGDTTDAFGTIHAGEYVGADDETYAISDFDFDLYVLDANSFEDVTGAGGATANSPEEVVVPADAPDGEYLIVADLYALGDEPAEEFPFDMTLYVTKFGTWDAVLPIDYFTSSSLASGGSGLGDGVYVAGYLTKTGTTYVLKDANSTTVAQGRMAALKAAVKGKRLAKK